jgi:hypothetical protein
LRCFVLLDDDSSVQIVPLLAIRVCEPPSLVFDLRSLGKVPAGTSTVPVVSRPSLSLYCRLELSLSLSTGRERELSR